MPILKLIQNSYTLCHLLNNIQTWGIVSTWHISNVKVLMPDSTLTFIFKTQRIELTHFGFYLPDRSVKHALESHGKLS